MFESGSDTEGLLAYVTKIPTIHTLRHFGSNLQSVLDLLILAINSHLIDAGHVKDPSPPATIPRLIIETLSKIPGFDIQQILSNPALAEILFAAQQDEYISAIIYQKFLNPSENCGASFPLLGKSSVMNLSYCAVMPFYFENALLIFHVVVTITCRSSRYCPKVLWSRAM